MKATIPKAAAFGVSYTTRLCNRSLLSRALLWQSKTVLDPLSVFRIDFFKFRQGYLSRARYWKILCNRSKTMLAY